VVVGRLEAEGPGEVDALLSVRDPRRVQRYVVAWTVQYRESGQLAKALIEQATEQQQISSGVLTVHADRGGPMRGKPVAFLLADLGVTKTTADRTPPATTPLQRSALQDAEIPARVPRALRRHRARPGALPPVP